MRHSHLLRLTITRVLPFIAVVPPALAQGPHPYVCMTRDLSKRTAYVSPVFDAPPAEAPKVNPAWNQVMTSKYGITALPYLSCQGPFPSGHYADSVRSTFIAYMQNSMEQKVVQLDWTYANVGPLAIAPPPPQPAPPPAAAPAVMTEAKRQSAQAGVANSKSYCAQNYSGGQLDCDCYAQSVFKHRLAHPEEWITDRDGSRWVPDHDLAVGIQHRLDCTECLEDQRLTAWARKTIHDGFTQQVMTGAITQAKADAFADCVAKGFPARWRANPYLDWMLKAMNEARVSCGNPGG